LALVSSQSVLLLFAIQSAPERTVTHAPATCSIAKQTNPKKIETKRNDDDGEERRRRKKENGLKHKNPILKTLRVLNGVRSFLCSLCIVTQYSE
jgi:hypothetical protein